jgi:hypothetical protein
MMRGSLVFAHHTVSHRRHFFRFINNIRGSSGLCKNPPRSPAGSARFGTHTFEERVFRLLRSTVPDVAIDRGFRGRRIRAIGTGETDEDHRQVHPNARSGLEPRQPPAEHHGHDGERVTRVTTWIRLYRPRFLGHRVEPYAALATG